MVSSKNERVLRFIVYVLQNRTAITKVTLNCMRSDARELSTIFHLECLTPHSSHGSLIYT